jgi:hypothetical protein
MIELSTVTEDEMIAAFLEAEIDSSSELPTSEIKRGLAHLGLTRSLIDNPNLTDAEENSARKSLLSYRGYDQHKNLFHNFPLDAVWCRARLESCDFKTMRYINDQPWLNLSGNTRLVDDGAHSFCQQIADPTTRNSPLIRDTQRIAFITVALLGGKKHPELIAAKAKDGSLIIIEGHARATAYVIAQHFVNIEALVASSASMPEWYFY